MPGFEVEVVGTDRNVDRRLSAVAEVDIPFYAGLKVGVPTPAGDRRDARRGPLRPRPPLLARARRASPPRLIARVMDVPVLGSYHTELAAYAGLRSADPALEAGVRMAIAAFYGQCATRAVAERGLRRGAALDGDRATSASAAGTAASTSTASRPGRRDETLLPTGEVNVLYAGRLTHEKGADLLADAFLARARARPAPAPRASPAAGPEEDMLRERLGDARDVPRLARGRRAGARRTRARTSSCSRAGRTRSARSCSRRRRAACRSSRSPRAARRRSSRTASPGGCARRTPRRSAQAVLELAASPAAPRLAGRGRAGRGARALLGPGARSGSPPGYRRALADGPAQEARRAA